MMYHRVCACVPKIPQRVSVPTRTVHLSSLPVLSGIRIAQSFAFCVLFCGSLSILLSIVVCPLWCLSFDLRIPITPLVPSNSSFTIYDGCHKWSKNWLPFRSSWIHLKPLQLLSWFVFLHLYISYDIFRLYLTIK
jgi:hypothetical protein